jgi:hypothetical protein
MPIPAWPAFDSLDAQDQETLQTIWNRAMCLGREAGLTPDQSIAPWRLPPPGRGYKSKLAALLERARQTLAADPLDDSLAEPEPD